MGSTWTRIGRAAGVAVAAVPLVVVAGTGSASGAVVERESFADSGEDFGYCLDTNGDGMVVAPFDIDPEDPDAPAPDDPTHLVAYDYAVNLTIHDATPATDGKFFRALFRGRYSEVWTNPSTGESFSISGHSITAETQAKVIPGGDETTGDLVFRWVEAGQPFVVRDGEGDLVMRDRGAVKAEVVFWSGDEGSPGGELISEEFSFAGPHEGWDTDVCALAEELTGPAVVIP